MVPHETAQYIGIVELFSHFGWNWIGLLVSDDDSGKAFIETLRPKLLQSKICVAFIQPIETIRPGKLENLLTVVGSMISNLRSDKNKVVLVYLEGLNMGILPLFFLLSQSMEKVWITTAQWDITTVILGNIIPTKSLNGTLSFALHTNLVPGFQDFLETINPYTSKIVFLTLFWHIVFACSFPVLNLYLLDRKPCTGEEKLRSLSGFVFEMGMSGQSYNVYNAVYATAHALHTMHSRRKQRAKGPGAGQKLREVEPWQVMHGFLIPSLVIMNCLVLMDTHRLSSGTLFKCCQPEEE